MVDPDGTWPRTTGLPAGWRLKSTSSPCYEREDGARVFRGVSSWRFKPPSGWRVPGDYAPRFEDWPDAMRFVDRNWPLPVAAKSSELPIGWRVINTSVPCYERSDGARVFWGTWKCWQIMPPPDEWDWIHQKFLFGGYFEAMLFIDREWPLHEERTAPTDEPAETSDPAPDAGADGEWLSELEARQIVRERLPIRDDGSAIASVGTVAALLVTEANRAYRKGFKHGHYRQLGKPPGP